MEDTVYTLIQTHTYTCKTLCSLFTRTRPSIYKGSTHCCPACLDDVIRRGISGHISPSAVQTFMYNLMTESTVKDKEPCTQSSALVVSRCESVGVGCDAVLQRQDGQPNPPFPQHNTHTHLLNSETSVFPHTWDFHTSMPSATMTTYRLFSLVSSIAPLGERGGVGHIAHLSSVYFRSEYP